MSLIYRSTTAMFRTRSGDVGFAEGRVEEAHTAFKTSEQLFGRLKGMGHTVLVVDDTASLRRMVDEYLSAEGFRVLTAEDGQQALHVARKDKPDLILLDIMMPRMGGYEFLRIYRQDHRTPIILLTAKVEETDKVVGLELGADDYVTKPFGMRELVARVRAVLRRVSAAAPETRVLRLGDIAVDVGQRRVEVRGETVKLTPSEFELLVTLMEAPGHVFSRTQLLARLQGIDFHGVERTIDVHVRNLRAKIEEDSKKPRSIETVFGVGYRFRPEDEDR
jgi:two-component system, OmpR family, alkaline phosphatase synthesis response regulator PhoP